MTRILLLFALLWVGIGTVSAQDFMLQGWYWDFPKPTTPLGPTTSPTWAKNLNTKVSDLSAAGFTHLWIPPASRASFGAGSNGYDPQDLYDLGEFGQGATGFGFRSDVDALVSSCNSNGIDVVADVVYNHRDGGHPEDNPAVKAYITTHMSTGKSAFPSDRYRCYLPLGGSSGNGAGDYYIKISSKTGASQYHNFQYRVFAETSQVGWQNMPDMSEAEPNGGGDCGQGSNTIQLGVNMIASVDDAAGCATDEFLLTLSASDFNPAGDVLYIYLNNNGGYSDHRIYGIWNAAASADVVNQLNYQSYTDFTSMPSGQGGMNFEDFKPNTSNAGSTSLGGDWDWLWFFYDYDQNNPATRQSLTDWSTWLWSNVGIRGYRMDAVKHFPPSFIGEMLNTMNGQGINPSMVVGEFFDSNPVLLRDWVADVYTGMNSSASSAINVRVFDFSLRNSLKSACDGFGYDVRNVFNSSLVDNQSMSGFNVATFVNNHDFRGPGEPVQLEPELAYAYILTNNKLGIPTVFYPEYYGVAPVNYPSGVNLKSDIDALMQLHQQFIFGANQVDYLNRFSTPYPANFISGATENSLIYQLSGGIGGGEVIVAINFSGNPLRVDQTINTFGAPQGTTFDDMLGNSSFPTAVVDGQNRIYIDLPPRSYSVWVESTAVPVELSAFSATPFGKCIDLAWTTQSEANFSHFEIERSTDGHNFEYLNSVPAQGAGDYTYADCTVEENTTYYYRLRSVDLDGTYEYSKIVNATLNGEDAVPFSVSPNPWQTALYLESTGEIEQQLQLQLFNTIGQPVWTGRLLPGQTQLTIEVPDLESGIYYLKWELGSRSTGIIKLVKT